MQAGNGAEDIEGADSAGYALDKGLEGGGEDRSGDVDSDIIDLGALCVMCMLHVTCICYVSCVCHTLCVCHTMSKIPIY